MDQARIVTNSPSDIPPETQVGSVSRQVAP